MVKVCHLSSGHSRNSGRIFNKQCCSLAKAGYDVSYVVADGQGFEEKSGVKVHDIGHYRGKYNRFVKARKHVFNKAKEIDADIYHLHDLELMPLVTKLRRLNKIVVFDSHEDLPQMILSRDYLTPFLRKIISLIISMVERKYLKKATCIVGATPFISERLRKHYGRVVTINNYPVMSQCATHCDYQKEATEVVYIGAISKIRGIKQVIHAFDSPDVCARLNLVGRFSDKSLEEEVSSYEGWQKVNNIGFVDRSEVNKVLTRSRVGLVTFLPSPNHTDAQPNKMFEYMAAGIPVIASHFPLWKLIIEEAGCGLLVDPQNPQEIAKAITWIMNHPDQAAQMGRRGQQAVLKKYNWAVEEKALMAMYDTLFNPEQIAA
jgi:glycosyltransferase involved in cell wall biosynthesis